MVKVQLMLTMAAGSLRLGQHPLTQIALSMASAAETPSCRGRSPTGAQAALPARSHTPLRGLGIMAATTTMLQIATGTGMMTSALMSSKK